jgi:enoyl-CoA hydratase/carnithine racemase
MIPYNKLLFESKDGVATLTLNSPENRNSLNEPLCKDLDRAIEEVRNDDSINVMVITGTGGSFSSGGDMKETLDIFKGIPFRETKFMNSIREDSYSCLMLSHRLYTFPKPTIAAVNGFAFGAGFSLALACDMRIATDDAKFCMAFAKRGFIPDIGGTYYLVRLVGIAKACELVFTADVLDAQEAGKIGIVNKVVLRDDLMAETKDMAGRIARNPALAVKMAKQALYQALIEPDCLTHLRLEQRINKILLDTEDVMEGVKAFMEKREPKYTGKW